MSRNTRSKYHDCNLVEVGGKEIPRDRVAHTLRKSKENENILADSRNNIYEKQADGSMRRTVPKLTKAERKAIKRGKKLERQSLGEV